MAMVDVGQVYAVWCWLSVVDGGLPLNYIISAQHHVSLTDNVDSDTYNTLFPVY